MMFENLQKFSLDYLEHRKKTIFRIIKERNSANLPVAGFYKEIGKINQAIGRIKENEYKKETEYR